MKEYPEAVFSLWTSWVHCLLCNCNTTSQKTNNGRNACKTKTNIIF